jgi:hypothetical protein
VTDRYGIRPYIRFGTELAEARWDRAGAQWQLRTSRGDMTADVVIAAAGPLSTPSLPDIPGLDTFPGPVFHSARWDHRADLAGKRVAVIGTGASAIQIVPAIQPVAGRLILFQRTPAWVMPRRDRRITGAEKWLYRQVPLTGRMVRLGLHASRELLAVGFKPNTELVAAGLAKVDGSTLTAQDGTPRDADVIIFATGFHVIDLPLARRITGAGGVTLAQTWGEDMRALRGTTIAGFPNLCLLIGPNTGLGHNSLIHIIEAQLGYALDYLDALDRLGAAALDASPQAEQRWCDDVQRRMASTVWATGCMSWYLNSAGRNPTLWPGLVGGFRRATRRLDLAEYHVIRAAAPPRAPRGAPLPRSRGRAGQRVFVREENSGHQGMTASGGERGCGGAQRDVQHGLAAARVHDVGPHRGQVLGARGEHRDPGAAGAQHRSLAQQRPGDQPPHAAFQPLGGPGWPAGHQAGHGREDVDLIQAGLGQGLQRRGRAHAAVHVAAAVDDGRLVPARDGAGRDHGVGERDPRGACPAEHHPVPGAEVHGDDPGPAVRPGPRRGVRRAAGPVALARDGVQGGDRGVLHGVQGPGHPGRAHHPAGPEHHRGTRTGQGSGGLPPEAPDTAALAP